MIYAYRDKLSKYILDVINNNNNDERLINQFIMNKELETNDIINDIIDVAADREINNVKGLYHRYPHKILVFPTESCLGSCRFCFRKNIINKKDLSIEDFQAITNYILSNDINEVIFSGGDPFAIKEDLLIKMINIIQEIDCVKIIRIHTRVLTYNPELITNHFIDSIKSIKPLYMVFHINSHLELTQLALDKVQTLVNSGILCFSQTALLHGVNDTLEDLKKLFTTLIENKIKPYYLFHPDRVKGTGHFYIPLKKGIELYNSLYNHISGLAMPIYLFNIPNGYGHCIVDLNNIKHKEDNVYMINTWQGETIKYEDIIID